MENTYNVNIETKEKSHQTSLPGAISGQSLEQATLVVLSYPIKYLLLGKRVRRKIDQVIGTLSGEIFLGNIQPFAKKLINVCSGAKVKLDLMQGMLNSSNSMNEKLVLKLWEELKSFLEEWQETVHSNDNITLNQIQKYALELSYKVIDNAISDEKVTMEDINAELQLTLFEYTLVEIKEYPAVDKISMPSCFISYAWGIKAHENFVHQLASQLKEVGIRVILDIWDNKAGDIIKFIERLNKADTILLMGTPLLKIKYDNPGEQGSYVHEELEASIIRIKKNPGKHGILKVLVSGDHSQSFPDYLERLPHNLTDFNYYYEYYEKFFNLLELIHEEALKFKNHSENADIPTMLDKYLNYLKKEYLELKALLDSLKTIKTRPLEEYEELLRMTSKDLKEFLHNKLSSNSKRPKLADINNDTNIFLNQANKSKSSSTFFPPLQLASTTNQNIVSCNEDLTTINADNEYLKF